MLADAESGEGVGAEESVGEELEGEGRGESVGVVGLVRLDQVVDQGRFRLGGFRVQLGFRVRDVLH